MEFLSTPLLNGERGQETATYVAPSGKISHSGSLILIRRESVIS